MHVMYELQKFSNMSCELSKNNKNTENQDKTLILHEEISRKQEYKELTEIEISYSKKHTGL